MHSYSFEKRLKKILIITASIFIAIVLYNWIRAYMIKRFFGHYQPPAVAVSSYVARAQDWKPYLHSVGNFLATKGVNVNSQASGSVVAIKFVSGQTIEKGQPLIDIDDQVEQATLKANQSVLALAEINYKRQTDLFKKGATPGSSVDEARAKLLQAQADVEKTQALIKQKHITAPFSGNLGFRKVNLGQFITPGQTSIVSLQALDPLFLEFHIPEQLINKISLNQKIYFTTEENPDIYFEGKITAIESLIDSNTHNIRLQATIPNCPSSAMVDLFNNPYTKTLVHPNNGKKIIQCNSEVNRKNKLKQFNFIPGMFASIEIEQPALKNIISIPTTAISYSLYGDSVYIIEKGKRKHLIC